MNLNWTKSPTIVVGIDIGATTTAVSFAYLTRGPVTVQHVSSWLDEPAEDEVPSNTIPTLICYDRSGTAKSFGAQAEADADANGYTLVKLFKLHLHDPSMYTEKQRYNMPDLPDTVSISKVYTDFMIFLFKCTRKCFEDSRADGRDLWKQHLSSMSIVIGHPNGWSKKSIDTLSSAAKAALATHNTDTVGTNNPSIMNNIYPITEVAASMHLCMSYKELRSIVNLGDRFIVCDAGGSTVDTTVYKLEENKSALRFTEIKQPACVNAGAANVDFELKIHLNGHFRNAGASSNDILRLTQQSIRNFECDVKPYFDTQSINGIYVGSYGTTNGIPDPASSRLAMRESDIESFFKPHVMQISASIHKQISLFRPPKTIFLVGGFAANPYLRSVLESNFKNQIKWVSTNNDPRRRIKEVADGSVLWFVAHETDHAYDIFARSEQNPIQKLFQH